MSSPDELSLLIREIVRLNRHLGIAMADELAIHTSDLQALDELAGSEPIGPAELGRRLGLGSAAATALVDRLERAGHVRRERHPADRRRVALVTTQHAGAEAMRVLAPYVGDLRAAAERLSEQDQAVVAAYLRDVIAVCRRHLERAERG